MNLFALGKALGVIMRNFVNMAYNYFGTKRLHKNMIETVSRAPVNTYFDTTPLGRIITKFSTDLVTLENDLYADI